MLLQRLFHSVNTITGWKHWTHCRGINHWQPVYLQHQSMLTVLMYTTFGMRMIDNYSGSEMRRRGTLHTINIQQAAARLYDFHSFLRHTTGPGGQRCRTEHKDALSSEIFYPFNTGMTFAEQLLRSLCITWFLLLLSLITINNDITPSNPP